ncbi:unnamed protein product, partial [Pelagomonas calceolata]
MRFSFLRWACAALASDARRFESARAWAAFLRDATLASRLRLAFSTLAARCFALAARPFARATRASCWRFDFASAASFLSRAFSCALYFFTSFFVLPAMPRKARASFFFSRVSAIWSRVFSLATSSGRSSPSSFLPFAVAAAAVFALSAGAFDALAAGAGAALAGALAGAGAAFA